MCWPEDAGGQFEDVADVCGLDGLLFAIVVVRRQGCCKWCAMLVQMQHASHGGDNGAEMRIAAAAKADDLPSDPVFLCGEFQRNKGG